MKLLYIVSIGAFVSACHSVPVVVVNDTYPLIGATATEGIGEPLLTQIEGSSVATIIISTDQKIGEVLIRRGKYAAHRESAEGSVFRGISMRFPASEVDKKGNLIFSANSKETKIVCVSKDICGKLDYSGGRAVSNTAKSSFQQTLIYSGKIGDKVTLGYREFSNNLAKPAFSNDVTYDLSVSSVIGYKGARLEVISANNTEITYKVLADFRK
jgi:hypothetical protein